jgi:hypothetical protein
MPQMQYGVLLLAMYRCTSMKGSDCRENQGLFCWFCNFYMYFPLVLNCYRFCTEEFVSLLVVCTWTCFSDWYTLCLIGSEEKGVKSKSNFSLQQDPIVCIFCCFGCCQVNSMASWTVIWLIALFRFRSSKYALLFSVCKSLGLGLSEVY